MTICVRGGGAFYPENKPLHILLLLKNGHGMSVLLKGSVEVEDGVLVLNAKNFDEALHTNKALLVEFYAPW